MRKRHRLLCTGGRQASPWVSSPPGHWL
uniref:Uncharacterized protein n=1 Tax=Rhizophora mucronata TaxID=61149 RepID=A0A2P2Q9V6_RHIMU